MDAFDATRLIATRASTSDGRVENADVIERHLVVSSFGSINLMRIPNLHSLCRAVYPPSKLVVFRAKPALVRLCANRSLPRQYAHIMSASSHPQPEIIGTEELKTEAKWLKLERIKWKDQEGKEVGTVEVRSLLFCRLMLNVTHSGSGRSPIERLEGRAGWIVRHPRPIPITTLQ